MKSSDHPLDCPLDADGVEKPEDAECDLVLVETSGNLSARCSTCGLCENFRLTNEGPAVNFAKGAKYAPELVDELRQAAATCAKERQKRQDEENAKETKDPMAQHDGEGEDQAPGSEGKQESPDSQEGDADQTSDDGQQDGEGEGDQEGDPEGDGEGQETGS